jgi:hypothetical protein
MSDTRAWEPYLAAEDPPRRRPCPLHEGQVLPCPRCLEWLAGPIRVTDAEVPGWRATLAFAA